MRAGRRDEEFAEFVGTRSGWLRKVAYLLTGDWHRADDLTQTTVTKLYTRWHRLGSVENVDGYARTTLVNSFLAERRSPWARVLLGRGEQGEEGPPPAVAAPDLDAVLDLRQALAQLPPRQRATVVLRYFCDLSVEQTAEALGCSPGTVKSQTARGLDALRRALEPDADLERERESEPVSTVAAAPRIPKPGRAAPPTPIAARTSVRTAKPNAAPTATAAGGSRA